MSVAALAVGTRAIVEVGGIATGGEGVGRLADGRAVFIPRTATGDRAEVELRRVGPRWARAALVRVLAPGPDRVEPRCTHYVADGCGGCQLQHLEIGAQRAAKSAIVGEALRRLGGRDVADPEVEPADLPWGYRHKLTLARDASGRLGLHPHDRPAEVFDLVQCEIADPRLMAAWRQVRRERGRLPADLARLVLRLDPAGQCHAVAVTGGRRPWPGAAAVATALGSAGAGVVLWWDQGDGPRRVDGLDPAAPPPTTFAQVAPGMGERIRRWAMAQLGPLAGSHVWDLYAGVGQTSRLLAGAGATVESVERDPAAVAGAGTGGPVERHVGRVEALLPRLRPAAAAVVNPPRTGLHEAAAAWLERRGPARVAYISCDPATLARDLRRMPGYGISALRAFDLFPQTAHVETVAMLERA